MLGILGSAFHSAWVKCVHRVALRQSLHREHDPGRAAAIGCEAAAEICFRFLTVSSSVSRRLRKPPGAAVAAAATIEEAVACAPPRSRPAAAVASKAAAAASAATAAAAPKAPVHTQVASFSDHGPRADVRPPKGAAYISGRFPDYSSDRRVAGLHYREHYNGIAFVYAQYGFADDCGSRPIAGRDANDITPSWGSGAPPDGTCRSNLHFTRNCGANATAYAAWCGLHDAHMRSPGGLGSLGSGGVSVAVLWSPPDCALTWALLTSATGGVLLSLA